MIIQVCSCCFVCVCTSIVSDQESEPAATAGGGEDAPVKLEEELKRFMSQATQTAGDVTEVANEASEGESGVEKLEDRHEHVQITASLSEVSILISIK